MIMETPGNTTSLKRSSAHTPLSADGGSTHSINSTLSARTPSRYANSQSYLKSRRTAAKQERRNEILSFLDSSLDNIIDGDLPKKDGLAFELSHSADKPKTRNKLLSSSSHGKPKKTIKKKKKGAKKKADASLPDDVPIEDVLNGLKSATDHDSTCTSASSLGFTHSSSAHIGSFASLSDDAFEFADDDDECDTYQEKTPTRRQDGKAEAEQKEEKYRKDVAWIQAKMKESTRLAAEEEARIHAEIDATKLATKLAEIEATKLAEIAATKLAEIAATKLAEIAATTLAEIEATKLAEIEATTLAEIEATKLAEIEAMKLAEIEATKLAEIEATKLAEIEAMKLADEEAEEEAVRKAAENDIRVDEVSESSYEEEEYIEEDIVYISDEEEILEEEFSDGESDEEYIEEIIEDFFLGHEMVEEDVLSDDEIIEELLETDDSDLFEDISLQDDESLSQVVAEEEYFYEEEIIEEEALYESDKVYKEELVAEEEVSSGCHDVLDIIEEEHDLDDPYGIDMIIEEILDPATNEVLGVTIEEEYFSDYEGSSTEGNPLNEEDLLLEDGEECVEDDDFEADVEYDDFEADIEYDDFEAYTKDDHFDADAEDDDFSIFEEEIIPQFDVPLVPAIVVWQKQEADRAAKEGDKPPEVAPRTPANVMMAVLAAATADFKLRKIPKEHKKRFVPMADSAACLGRLMQLNENVVEAMGRASAVKVDNWKPSGRPIVLQRSMNLRIVNEAASMGRMVRLKERYITNYEELNKFEGKFEAARRVDIDDLVDERGHRIFRTAVLVQQHVRDAKQEAMTKDWIMGALEESAEADEITLESVKLPTQRLPRFNKPCASKLSPSEINDAIARGVAEGAWDRKYRLERPQIKLRVTSMCRCRYCEHPNAFQTHAYKKLRDQIS